MSTNEGMIATAFPWRASNIDLPRPLEELRQVAKQSARESDYDKAYEHNLRLAEQSRSMAWALGEVIGLRFAGVCEYRRERYAESKALLEQAVELARAGDFHQQQLHLANHLGATLRRLGRFEEALDTLRSALDQVRLPEDLEAKARLLGNLGAFYDEIGNEQGADDCYARYEELIEVLVHSGDADDGARLANARALSARAALRRRDLDTAKKKHDAEFSLAKKSGDKLRQRDAAFHRGKIQLELALHAQKNDQDPHVYFKEAAAAFDDAHERIERDKHRARMADLLHHRGRLCEARGQWAEAYGAWRQAWSTGRECNHLYRQAESSRALARFCQRWALHGESLYWFREAARIHYKQYAPLAKSTRIAGLAHARVAELHDVATKLADESRRVERENDESDEINKLVKDVTGKAIADLAAATAFESVHAWQKRVREESRTRWKELLTPARFEQLEPQSRDDLVMADMLYHGIVDELPRSALLIAIVVERELRERLFVPLHKAYPHRTGEKLSWRRGRPPATVEYLNQNDADNVPIGNQFRMLREILRGSTDDMALRFARERTRPLHETLKKIAHLNGDVKPLGGAPTPVRFASIRNEAAHGSERAARLDRMTVDALKRRLLLESPMIMISILDLDLRGALR